MPRRQFTYLCLQAAALACGSGKMVDALRSVGFDVVGSDISAGRNFLTQPAPKPICGIITNLPYELATEFIYRALLINASGRLCRDASPHRLRSR